MQFFNRVAVSTATTGTGTLTFGSALSPKLLTPVEAGAVDADEVAYLIEDGSDFEIGTGTIGGSETTLSRDVVLVSKIGGTAGTSKIDLSGAATVRLVETAEFLNDVVRSGDLGNSAARDVGTTAGTVAEGDDSRITGAIQGSLLTTRGDMIRRGASAPERFAKGTQHQVLLAGADDPAWGAVNLAQAAAVTGVLPAGNHPAASTTASGISEQATAAEYRTGTDTTRHLGVAETWGAAALSALTDGSDIAVNLASGFNFGGASNAVLALGGNRNLSAPSNLKTGETGVLWFGAASSTRTLTLNAAWLLMDGVEVGPYSITTSQILGVAYWVRASVVYVTAILRRAA